MANTGLDLRGDVAARNIALLNYALLFLSIFFAGVTALIAVVIAYYQRDQASPLLRAHHNFQIRIFWVGFVLLAGAGISGLGAAVGIFAEVLTAARLQGLSGWEEVRLAFSQLALSPAIVVMAILAGAFSFLAFLWLAAAPTLGFIRLASARSLVHSPRP